MPEKSSIEASAEWADPFNLYAGKAPSVSLQNDTKHSLPAGMSQRDWDDTVDTVIAEAGGEGDDGMAGVAYVIRNRSNIRGKSIGDVVREPDQFTGYAQPGAKAVEAMRDPAMRARAEGILRSVLTSDGPDPTEGSDHYHAESVNPYWAASMPQTVKISGHVYYNSRGGTQGKEPSASTAYVAEQEEQGLYGPKGQFRELLQGDEGKSSAPNPSGKGLARLVREPEEAPRGAGGKLSFVHAGQENINPQFASILTETSKAMGRDFTINSGYRSPSHRVEASKPGGPGEHSNGTASDISMKGMSEPERQQLVRELRSRGAMRFIVYKNSPDMLHVDMKDQTGKGTPWFMYDRSNRNMPNAPTWFQEVAANSGQSKKPETLEAADGFGLYSGGSSPITQNGQNTNEANQGREAQAKADAEAQKAFDLAEKSSPGKYALLSESEAAERQAAWEAENQSSGLAGDIGRMLGGANAQLGLAVRESVGMIPKVGPSIVRGLDAIDEWVTGKPVTQRLNEYTDRANASVTERQQVGDAKDWWDDEKGTFGPAWSDPRSYLGGVVRSLPTTFVTMAPGGILARGAYLRTLAAGATERVAAAAAARTATIAGGLSEGVLVGGESSINVKKRIDEMPRDQLEQSDAVKAMIDGGMSPDDAINALRDDAATQAYIVSGVATGIFGGQGDRVLANIISERVSGGIARRLVSGATRGAVGEGLLEELPQSVAQTVSENAAVRRVKADQDLLEGVEEAAASGVAVGGAMGGAMGGVGGLARPRRGAGAEQSAPQGIDAPEAEPDNRGPLRRAADHGQQRGSERAAAADAGAPIDGRPATRATVRVEAEGIEPFMGTVESYEGDEAVVVDSGSGEVYQVPLANITQIAPPIEDYRFPERSSDGMPEQSADPALEPMAPVASQVTSEVPPRSEDKPATEMRPTRPQPGQRVIVDTPEAGRFAARIERYENEGNEALVIDDKGNPYQVPTTALNVSSLTPAQVEAQDLERNPPIEREIGDAGPNSRKIGGKTVVLPDDNHAALYDLAREQIMAKRLGGTSQVDMDKVMPTERKRLADAFGVKVSDLASMADDYRYRAESAAMEAKSKLPVKMHAVNDRLLKQRQAARAKEAVEAQPQAADDGASWWEVDLTDPDRKRILAEAGVKRPERTPWATMTPGIKKKLLDVRDAQRAAAEDVAMQAGDDEVSAKIRAIADEIDQEDGAVHPDHAEAAQVDDAAHKAATSPTNDLPEPTQAQKEAGNYRLGHIKLGGMDISIENPAGSQRNGVSPSGKAWSVTMKSHYGYIRSVNTSGSNKSAPEATVAGTNVARDAAQALPVSDQSVDLSKVNGKLIAAVTGLDTSPSKDLSQAGTVDAENGGNALAADAIRKELYSFFDVPLEDPDIRVEALITETVRNSTAADTHLFGDATYGHAIRAQGFNSLDVELQSMVKARMLTRIKNRKVAENIVDLVPVPVMDMLRTRKGTTDSVLNDHAVLLDSLSGAPPFDDAIAVGRFIDAVATSLPIAFALRIAEKMAALGYTPTRTLQQRAAGITGNSLHSNNEPKRISPKGADKDHIDIFVKPGTETLDDSSPIFVVDQIDPARGRFDEHKTLAGFDNEAQARAAYLENYTADWKGLGDISQTTLGDFKNWLKSGKTKDPFAPKWFASQDKADAYVAKNKMGQTHEVVQRGKRFEVLERSRTTPAIESTKPSAFNPSEHPWSDVWASDDEAVSDALSKIASTNGGDTPISDAIKANASNKELLELIQKRWGEGGAGGNRYMIETGKGPSVTITLEKDEGNKRIVLRGKDLADAVRKEFAVSLDDMRQAAAAREVSEPVAPAPVEQKPKPKPAVSENKLFTDDAAAKARELLRKKLSGNTLNSGIDPELLQAGITLAGYHIEKGARTFAAYASAMLADLGEGVRPYLKSWYAATVLDPRFEAIDGLTPLADLPGIDVSAIDAEVAATKSVEADSNVSLNGVESGKVERSPLAESGAPVTREPIREDTVSDADGARPSGEVVQQRDYDQPIQPKRADVSFTGTRNDLTHVGLPSAPEGVAVFKWARDTIHRFAKNGHEYLMAVDDDGTVVEFGTAKKKASTGINNRLVGAMLNPDRRLVVFHNHPRGGPLSGDDIAMLAFPGMHSVWAFGSNGAEMRAALTPSAERVLHSARDPVATMQALSTAIADARNEIGAFLASKVREGAITPDRAEEAHNYASVLSSHRAGLIDITSDKNYNADEIDGLNDKLDNAAAVLRESIDNGDGSYTDQRVSRRPARDVRHVAEVAGMDGRGERVAVRRPSPEGLSEAGSSNYQGEIGEWRKLARDFSDVKATRENIVSRLRGVIADNKSSILATVPLNYFPELAGDKIPAINDYLLIKRKMDAYRSGRHDAAAEVMDRWRKYISTGFLAVDKSKSQALADLMHDATLAGIDPSLTTEEERAKPGYDRLRKRFTAIAPIGQKLFTDVRDAYREQADELDRLLLDNVRKAQEMAKQQAEREFKTRLADIEASDLNPIDRRRRVEEAQNKHKAAMTKSTWASKARMTQLRVMFESNRVPDPYFPLARFGDYFVSVKTPVKNEEGEIIGHDVLHFSRHEKSREKELALAEIKREFPDAEVTSGMLSQGGELKAAMDPRVIADLDKLLVDADVKDDIRDALYQRWLQTMPDLSMRKRAIHRKGTAGYNTDAFRVFASTTFHAAHQMARLKYGLELQENVNLAEEQAKAIDHNDKEMALVNELFKRHQWTLNPTTKPLTNYITSAAFVYFLGATPAAALVNASQTVMVGVPVLSAKFGFGKSSAELIKATREFTNAVIMETKTSHGIGDFFKNAGDLRNASTLTSEERAAMEAFYESGLIDRTQSHDLAAVGETGTTYNPIREKVMNIVSYGFHKVEVFNRTVTAMAAYRLAREQGQSHLEAINVAHELTYRVHFDMSNTSRPRLTQKDGMRILTMFRSFQINMLFRLFRDVHQSVKGESAQLRREARLQLAGVTGMMALNAGLTGTVGYGLAMAAGGILKSMFGDDDDPLEFEERFRSDILELLGPELGGIVLKGVPGHYLGIDLTSRIGMPDLWWRSESRELDSDEAWTAFVMQNLGAAGGMAANIYRGYNLAIEGNLERGVETAAPKFIRDMLRTARYASDGVESIRGDQVIAPDDLSAWNLASQAMGFTPAKIADAYEVNTILRNAEKRIRDRKRSIVNRFAKAIEDGDTEGRKKALEDIAKYNAGSATKLDPITAKGLKQSLRMRLRNRQRSVGGVLIRNEALNQYLRSEVVGASSSREDAESADGDEE